ncbi:MAG TPA: hypothetical protein VFE63_10485 [Roseiarcus sp.]|nr:hypothetical protein [Roseiarcus sp.]
MTVNEAPSLAQIGISIGGQYVLDVLAENDGRPSPEEGSRLMLAFLNIRRPAHREAVINFVTQLSGRHSDGGDGDPGGARRSENPDSR